jgi:hypothetical protein
MAINLTGFAVVPGYVIFLNLPGFSNKGVNFLIWHSSFLVGQADYLLGQGLHGGRFLVV